MKQISLKNEKEYKDELNKYLLGRYNVKFKDASTEQIFNALSEIVCDKLYDLKEKENAVASKRNAPVVHYLSIEFLLGKSLKNNLFNLGDEEIYKSIFEKNGKSLQDVYNFEDEACLGNGGLGRLAACYLDSTASLGYPAYGHCIKYDFGLFKQKIINGDQYELPDTATNSEVWMMPRGDESCTVYFGGNIVQTVNQDGTLNFKYINALEVQAYPYDMLISGYNGKKVNVLKLWQAKSNESFDTKKFSQGEYAQAMAVKDEIESISKVLYPADDHDKGKSLRLKQEYFLASAVAQNIVNNHIKNGRDVLDLPNFVKVHINDTHPVLVIPEFMRILMDEHRLGWEDAFNIVAKMISFTNHTLLKESLAVKEINLLDRYLPRIAMIIRELDKRFRDKLNTLTTNKQAIDAVSIIKNGKVDMTNLAVMVSTKVNGVSAVHSLILKNTLLKEHNKLNPEQIINITNGVTLRRWLAECNPELHKLITLLIGDDYLTNATELEKLDKYANNTKVLQEMQRIKYDNKVKFANFLQQHQGVVINPNSRFDVQIKRIHEYKRQLLNVLKIIYLYSELKENPNKQVTPQTFIIGGKAASGYYMAKRIIKLIYKLSKDIDKNKQISKKLKLVFVENYSVSVAELLMPATDVTEQISLAGREASGTGNMKAVMNGALMLHTSDGANIEISERCGAKNSFCFGLTPGGVEQMWKSGYNPKMYYENSTAIQTVIKMLKEGFDGESFADIASYLLHEGGMRDIYMCLADFDSYLQAHNNMDKAFKNKNNWNSKVLHNISCMGYFSSDRAVEEYATKVWKLKKV